jgi:superfamily II DNA or RNA helicase
MEDKVMTVKGRWRDFESAREWARNSEIRSQRDWAKHYIQGKLPCDLPCKPDKVYENWKGWGDFLGTWRLKGQKTLWLPYDEAKKIVQSLKLSSSKEYDVWHRSRQKHFRVPAKPDKVYENWKGWGDFLGTWRLQGSAMSWLPFDEVKEIAHSLGISSSRQWYAYYNSEQRHPRVPLKPCIIYKDEWKGWGDFLGVVNRWDNKALLAFLESLHSCIEYLDQTELNKILRREGAMHGLMLTMGVASPQILLRQLKEDRGESLIAALTNAPDEIFETSEEDTDYTLETDNQAVIDFVPPVINDQTRDEPLSPLPTMPFYYEGTKYTLAPMASNESPSVPNVLLPRPSLASLEPASMPSTPLPAPSPIEEIKAPVEPPRPPEQPVWTPVTQERLQVIDKLNDTRGIDEDIIESMVIDRINDLWELYMNEGSKAVNKLLNAHGGQYFTQIKRRFNAEKRAVNALKVPDGWSFRDAQGKLCQPNLMQRRIAYLVQKERRIGNWSDVGAGKTLSAILAAYVVGAMVTLVITNNATVTQWESTILNAYPVSFVCTELEETQNLPHDQHCFVVVNYEKFQLDHRRDYAEQLLALSPDFIVFDEVQLVKQRYIEEGESHRREVLRDLVDKAAEVNPSLYVLGMSATPVINNLTEAKGLLEIITGKDVAVGTLPTVNNALELHEHFVKSGPRYRPRYEDINDQDVPPVIIKEARNDLLDGLIDAQGSPLSMEQALLQAKLDLVRPYLTRGTMVYTYYIDGIIEPTKRYLEDMGLTMGLYTGGDKSGLELFLRGDVDVLLGSNTISTGLDGLQRVSNRLVALCLPWTFAEWKQLIGRLRRQGQTKQVEVVVPQITLDYKGNVWSWDQWRLALIEYKQSLTDCVLDGKIPDAVRMSQREFMKQSREALEKWIARINMEEAS